jgi:hypothetical protein
MQQVEKACTQNKLQAKNVPGSYRGEEGAPHFPET